MRVEFSFHDSSYHAAFSLSPHSRVFCCKQREKNYKFQKLHYPLEQGYGVKKISYDQNSFHWAYGIKLAFKLRNVEKRGEKNVGTKNVTLDYSSSTFTAQTDSLFKTLKGENMLTAQQHIPI